MEKGLSIAQLRFNEAWDLVETEVPFEKGWSNGTGYFNGAISGPHAPALKSGQFIKAKTPGGRRIIIQGTWLGNIAVFDRHEADHGIFCHNSSRGIELGQWLHNVRLSDADMEEIFDMVRTPSLKEALFRRIHAVREEIINQLKEKNHA